MSRSFLRRRRLRRLLVPAAAALALLVPSISSATDPTVVTCPAAVATDGGQPDAGTTGPAGPVGPLPGEVACGDGLPAGELTTVDAPGPQAPEAAVVPNPPADGDQTSDQPAVGAGHGADNEADLTTNAEPASAPEHVVRHEPQDDTAAEPVAPVETGAPAPHADAPADPGTRVAEAAPGRHASRTLTAPRRPHRRHRITEASDVYFPPVFVDWSALTPLAPPEFGLFEAARFPGPRFLLPIYQAAAVQYDVPWQILAAINEIETDYGANTQRSSAGAVGWMQFLPSSWRTWGTDANGDGVANPQDPVDAIFAAARYLHDAGSLSDLGRAVFAYNHANWYVSRVLERAAWIGSIPEDLLTTLTESGRKDADAIHRVTGASGYLDPRASADTIGRVMLLGDDALARATLADDRVQIYSCGRLDIAAGIIDRRVLETIEYLAFRDQQPSVTSLRCGHGFQTKGGSVSEHSYGAALDVARVNGVPVLGHQGPGSITDHAIQQLLKLGGAMRPHQIISLMTFAGAANTLALGDHDDHIHIGFAPVRPLAGS